MKTSHATADSLADVAGEHAKEYVDAGVDAYHAVAKKSRAIGQQVDGYVRNNPWLMIEAAAGLGVLVGMLIRRH